MRKIEEKRLLICYGKRKAEKEVIDFWNKIIKLICEDDEKE